jgi:hypothetical protein
MTQNFEAKAAYELSKLTSFPRQALDSFAHAAVMTMFKDYIASFSDPERALVHFLDAWEENTVNQKNMEIKAMTEETDSMQDLFIGMAVTNTEDINKFKEEVKYLKEGMYNSIMSALRDDGIIGDDDEE